MPLRFSGFARVCTPASIENGGRQLPRAERQRRVLPGRTFDTRNSTAARLDPHAESRSAAAIHCPPKMDRDLRGKSKARWSAWRARPSLLQPLANALKISLAAVAAINVEPTRQFMRPLVTKRGYNAVSTFAPGHFLGQSSHQLGLFSLLMAV